MLAAGLDRFWEIQLKIELEEENVKREELRHELDRQLSEQPLVESKLSDLEKQVGDGSRLSPSKKAAVTSKLMQMKAQVDENEKKVSQLKNAADELTRSVQKKGIELTYKLRVGIWEGEAGVAFSILGLGWSGWRPPRSKGL